MSPVQLTVRLEGDDKVRAGLHRFATSIRPLTREAVNTMMNRALKRSIPYLGGTGYGVPERGYRRTGNLGRSGQVVQEGLSSRIEVAAYSKGREYGQYVVGRADGSGQAYMHVGWWMPLRTAVDLELEDLTGKLDSDLEQSAEAAGL